MKGLFFVCLFFSVIASYSNPGNCPPSIVWSSAPADCTSLRCVVSLFAPAPAWDAQGRQQPIERMGLWYNARQYVQEECGYAYLQLPMAGRGLDNGVSEHFVEDSAYRITTHVCPHATWHVQFPAYAVVPLFPAADNVTVWTCAQDYHCVLFMDVTKAATCKERKQLY